MLSFSRSATLAALFALTTAGAYASDRLRLSTVATLDGYSYQWLPTENGAMLSRPGVRIVVRAGSLYYEVNDATPIADTMPTYDGRDILISPKLAEHLRLIALRYPNATHAMPHLGASGNDPMNAPMAPVAAAATATTMTLAVKQVPGHEALRVSGVGTANTSVRIVLAAEMSQDLPIVTLMAQTVTSDAHGAFTADLGYGQDPHPHTFLTITATSADGMQSASSRFEIGYPAPQLSTPGLDVFPKN